MFSYCICIFVGVRHAWIELEISVALRMSTNVVANRGNLVVRRAHEDSNAFIVAASRTLIINSTLLNFIDCASAFSSDI